MTNLRFKVHTYVTVAKDGMIWYNNKKYIILKNNSRKYIKKYDNGEYTNKYNI